MIASSVWADRVANYVRDVALTSICMTFADVLAVTRSCRCFSFVVLLRHFLLALPMRIAWCQFVRFFVPGDLLRVPELERLIRTCRTMEVDVKS